MKNLMKAIETEQKKRLTDFIHEVNNTGNLSTWRFTDLIPRGKDISNMPIGQLRAYLIKRKEKAIYKNIERENLHISRVNSVGDLLEVKINVEWKRSRMWGSNPNAECWYSYKDQNGEYKSGYIVSGSVGGCGYDKLSTAVAKVLNQIDAVLKPLYELKNKNIKTTNHELLGYGSGYGIVPDIEGGVGVSCYPKIFSKIGYNFKTIASGKSFDSFSITPID